MENQFNDFSTYGSKSLDIFTLSVIPQHIRMTCPNFVKFIELWLRKISQPGEGAEFIHNMLYYANVDETSKDFLEIFCENYLKPLSYLPEVNKQTLIKWIRQWYEAIGSQQSYKFLFRVLFNQDVDFYFPSIDILRPSDGKWMKEYIMRTYKTHEDSFYDGLEGTIIRGEKSKAEALIERATINHYEGTHNSKEYDCVNLYVREIDPRFPITNFSNGENVIMYKLDDPNNTWSEKLTYIVSSITIDETIESNNFYYEKGDIIHVQHKSGYGCVAMVDEVSSGHFYGFDIVDAGSGYKVGERISIEDKYGFGFYGKISKVSTGELTPKEQQSYRELYNSLGYTDEQIEDAIAQLMISGAIEEISIEQTGEGYRTIPTVTIASEKGSGAFLIPKPVNVGSIKSIMVIDPGVEYINESDGVTSFQEKIFIGKWENYPREDINEPYTGNLYNDQRNIGIPAPVNNEISYLDLTDSQREIADNLRDFYKPYIFPIQFTRDALPTKVYTDQILKFIPNGKKAKGMFELGDYIMSYYKNSEMTSSYIGGKITKIDYGNNVIMVELDDFTRPFTTGQELFSPDSQTMGYLVQQTAQLDSNTINFNVGPVSKVPPYYKNRDSWLDSEKSIQDSYYYQAFSYALITDITESQWRTAVEDAVNPAGFIVFHNFSNENLISCSYGGDAAKSDTCIPCSERNWLSSKKWASESKCHAFKAFME